MKKTSSPDTASTKNSAKTKANKKAAKRKKTKVIVPKMTNTFKPNEMPARRPLPQFSNCLASCLGE